MSSTGTILGTTLKLRLRAQRTDIDELFAAHPQLTADFALFENIAVAAKISQIETEELLGPDGEKETAKIGSGDLIDVTYIGATRI